nr:1,4-alpha-glucan branching protein GlgB [uncultured Niameybacter sp.]
MEKFNLFNQDLVLDLLKGDCKEPHSLLGLHTYSINGKDQLTVCIYMPSAINVSIAPVENRQKCYQLEQISEEGLFFAILPRRKRLFKYYVFCEDKEGNKWEYVDAYGFTNLLDGEDINLFKEGIHYQLYKTFGAHYIEIEGILGVRFTVWAPEAKRVSVIGDFNLWDGRRHAMSFIESIGVWEIFIPGLQEGSAYKFEIKTKEDKILYKADPYALMSELRPYTASRTYKEESYKWSDKRWLERRGKKSWHKEAISIYELHMGSWKRHLDGRFYTYRELADDLVKYIKDMGYTHIELIGVLEHPYDGSWGYQVTGYFAPTSRYGSPDDFKYFIDVMHRHQIGVILDWVPAHFPKDAFGLEKFDGTPLYEHFFEEQAQHPQWGTLIFNYGRKEVCMFLINSALLWFDAYHIDGLRVDAVASMLYLDFGREGAYTPNIYGGRENLEAVAFLKELNTIVYEKHAGIMMIAEESTDWVGVTSPVAKGGLGFGFKWNMGWMNDYLKYMKADPLFRKYEHEKITFSLMYAFNENFILPLSHDEVVHGKSPMIYKMPGDEWHKFANLRVCYGYMFMHPGKKLLFMGNEFGQTSEWNEKEELKWGLLQYKPHRQMKEFVKDLNHFYKENKCLWELDHTYEGFEWIDCDNKDLSIVAFIRKGKKKNNELVVVVNFTPVSYKDYRIGINQKGVYEEVLSSDDIKYGGSGIINSRLETEEGEWQGRENYISMNIPPLGISVLKLVK